MWELFFEVSIFGVMVIGVTLSILSYKMFKLTEDRFIAECEAMDDYRK